MAEPIVIRVAVEGGDEAAVKLDRVAEGETRVGRHAEEAGAKMGMFSRGLTGLTRGIGFALGATGLMGLTFGLGDAIKKAQAFQEAVAQLSVAVKDAGLRVRPATKAFSEFADSLAMRGGFDPVQTIQGLTMLVRVTKSVHGAETAMSLATNIARGAHRGLEQSVKAVMMAEAGRLTGLTRLGIILPKHISSTKALAILQERYSGATAAYSKTSAGAFGNLSHMLDILGEKLGALILPYLTKAALGIAHFVEQFQKGVGVGGAFRRVLEGLWAAIKPIGAAIGSVISGIGSAFSSIGSSVTAGGSSSPLSKFLKDAKSDALGLYHAFLPVGTAIVGAIKQIGNAAKSIFGGEFGKDVLIIIGDLMKFDAAIYKFVLGVVKSALPGVVLIFKGAFNIIAGIIKFVANLLTGHFGKAFSALGQIVKGAVQIVGGIFLTILKPIGHVIGLIIGAFSGIGKAIGGVFQGVVNIIIGAINFVIDAINSVIRGYNSVAGSIPILGGDLTIGQLGHVGNWGGPPPTGAPRGHGTVGPRATGKGGVPLAHHRALGGFVYGQNHMDNVPWFLKRGEYVATDAMVQGAGGKAAMDHWRATGEPPGGNENIVRQLQAALSGMAVVMDGKQVGTVMIRQGLNAKALK